MKEALKSVKIFDWFIVAAAVIILLRMDFSNLTEIDMIYLATLIIWAVLFVLRLVIVAKRGGEVKS